MTEPAGRNGKFCLALIALGIILFTLAATSMNWVKYVSLRSTWPSDLGSYHNAAFNYAHGRTITYVLSRAWFDLLYDYNGPSIFRWTHFSPMGTLLIPSLYRLWPRITTLFALQSLAIALGALPLYLFGTRQTRNPRFGLVLALSYLLHPAILHTAFNDYRPIQLGIAPALFALWFHATRRPLPFAISALLMLSCRPEYTVLLASFGLINWRTAGPERRAPWALAPLLLAGLWVALTNAYYLYFFGRPWPIGMGVPDTPPGGLLARLLERLPAFIRLTLLPGVAGLMAPEALLVAFPFVAGAITVEWPSFPHHDLQHLSPAFAVVFWAFATGLVRLWPWLAQQRPRVAWAHRVLLAAALLSVAEFGWSASRSYLVGGFPRYEEITRASAALPADATVLLPMPLVARFSDHTRVIISSRLPMATGSLLSPAEVTAAFVGLVWICDLVVTERDKEHLTALVVQSGRYLPPQTVDRYHIFLARPDAPRPANPDALLQKLLRWDRMEAIKRRWAKLSVE